MSGGAALKQYVAMLGHGLAYGCGAVSAKRAGAFTWRALSTANAFGGTATACCRLTHTMAKGM